MMQQVQALLKALGDDREGLRGFAMRRLVAIGPAVIPQVVELLGSGDERVQECAAIVLATLKDDSVPLLVEAMGRHGDRRVRWGAAWVLSAIGADARGKIPPVSVPQAEGPAPRQGRKPTEAWSDSWLTKIRQSLVIARSQVVLEA